MTALLIYYLRFTSAGFGERASMIAMLLLVGLTPRHTAESWLRVGAWIAVMMVHAFR
jgi:hypothetical protein